MSKITRKTQLQFGSSAALGPGGIGQFGSFAASAIAYSKDPAVIQALANYLEGWSGAVIGANSPAIEDENSLAYLWAYQLGYVLQQGVGEWDSGTPYFVGSLASANGLLYAAIANSTNVTLNQQSDWKVMNGPVYDIIAGTAPYCTHSSLAVAAADGNYGDNQNVLIATTDSSSTTINLTRNGWRIYSLPGVSFTSSGGAGGLNISGANVWVFGCRLAGFTTALTFTSGSSYGKVMFCNFQGNTTDINDSSPAGKKVVPIGNIDE